MSKGKVRTLDDLWKRVMFSPGGCWEWTGYLSTKGYGRVGIGGASRPAHRVFFEMEYGPIPAGLVIDHLCRNPPCVNPLHLEAVTQAENARRSLWPAAVNARKTTCARGHALILRKNGKRRCDECTAQHNREYGEKHRKRLSEQHLAWYRRRREAAKNGGGHDALGQ